MNLNSQNPTGLESWFALLHRRRRFSPTKSLWGLAAKVYPRLVWQGFEGPKLIKREFMTLSQNPWSDLASPKERPGPAIVGLDTYAIIRILSIRTVGY